MAPRARLASQLKAVFGRIGVPPVSPFRPDPFQLQALEALQSEDVLVIAPTGSGKTWIAQEAIRTCLEQDKRIWYASPLKALSNSKYREFTGIFDPPNVGILTGDRKENADAPLIVGTTEILRNQLYDAMMEGRDISIDLAILDEAHYLSDSDRGVVWEEVLIYLPKRVRLLLLSATIGNGEEIRRWLEEIRGVRCQVVQSEKRPVPLHFLFLFPDGELSPLATHRGVLPKIKKFLATRGPSNRSASNMNSNFGWIIDQLRRWNLLPAIFFLKSRSDCDQAIQKNPPTSGHTRNDLAFRRDLQAFLKQYPFLRDHRQLPYLERFRVGSHHGGQLPQWKLLIEEMMNRGYLDAIFSTSTVAAGVNFPARTVVLVQSDRFDGRRFSDLTATELQQMTGRAGRRGKDRVGFALILPGLYQDPILIHQLNDSPPEPIRSQIQISFSMILNLLRSHRPAEIQDLLDSSLAAFQGRQYCPDLKREWSGILPKLKDLLPDLAICHGSPVDLLKTIQMESGLRERVQVLRTEIARKQRELLVSQYLKRGRLFVHQKGRIYVVFRTFYHKEKLYCSAHPLAGAIRSRKNQIRLKKISVQAIDQLLDYRVEIPEDPSRETLDSIFASIPLGQLQPFRFTSQAPSAQEEALRRAELELAALPDLHALRVQARYDKNTRTHLKRLERLAVKSDQIRHRLWNEFRRYLDFLKETGFVDQEDRLTADGRWASCLRLDHPLLIAEVIRTGMFHETTPPILAGLMAPFVVDKTREVEVYSNGMRVLDDLRVQFAQMARKLEPLQRLKRIRGFETLEIQFWPAACLTLWASGMAWNDLLRMIGVEEGDMAILIVRTADHLRQLFDLSGTHPELAETARQAISHVFREPVLIH
jgi:superfamily II RNA helicase